MAFCMRSLCHSFRNTLISKGDLSNRIFLAIKSFRKSKIPEAVDPNEFKVFYSFPRIVTISILSSARYVKMAAVFGISGIGYFGYRDGTVPEDALLAYVMFGLATVLLMFLVSHLSTNLIGKMYTNKSASQVVISSLNRRGKRINKTFDTSELIISDHPNALLKNYVKQITCSTENVTYNLYYSERGAKMDFFVFVKVFPNFE